MNWYLEVLQKYAQFSGRARRMEYWMFALFNIIIVLALALVSVFLEKAAEIAVILLVGYFLAIFIPGLAVAVRRLHDTGRNGLWLLLAFVPFGGIVLLVFYLLPGESGENAYGPNPKIAV